MSALGGVAPLLLVVLVAQPSGDMRFAAPTGGGGHLHLNAPQPGSMLKVVPIAQPQRVDGRPAPAGSLGASRSPLADVVMRAQMIRVRAVQVQVGQRVVRSVAVPMMNNLAGGQRPAQRLRHDQAVFEDVAVGVGHRMVAADPRHHVAAIGEIAAASPSRRLSAYALDAILQPATLRRARPVVALRRVLRSPAVGVSADRADQLNQGRHALDYIGDMPLEHTDALALRTWCKTSGGQSWCVAVKPKSGWRAQPRAGWRVVEEPARGLVRLER